MGEEELVFLAKFVMAGGVIAFDEEEKHFIFQRADDKTVGYQPFFLDALREAMTHNG